MINPNWSKFIRRAILKHFRTNLAPVKVYAEEEKKDTDPLSQWVEIRLDIEYVHLNNGSYKVNVEVDILIMSVKGNNIYDVHVLTGAVASKFSTLSVLDNTPSFLFCLKPNGLIRDTYYGDVETNQNMEQAVVEGRFEAQT